MSQSFLTFYNNIDFVEIDGDAFSIFENSKRLMTLPKSALSVLISNYDNILLDFEEYYEMGRKYWTDGETVMYTKTVLENDGTSNDNAHVKIFCILQIPCEVTLTKEGFQSMLISAGIACRIEADDPHRTTPLDLPYYLNSTKSIIFHDSRFFTILDETAHIEFDLPMSALVKMVMCKQDILDDLRDDDVFDEIVYWSDRTFQIKSEFLDNFRVLCFGNYENDPIFIRIRDRTFETMMHITMGGPSWAENMDDRIREIREIYWNSIPINTVKRIAYSRDGRNFTLINEANGEILTLPISALKAIKRYKYQILYDLDDDTFQPTYQNDYMNEYWRDDVYAVRTGVFYNLHRSIDCNVVRFTRLKDNYYMFVLQRRDFEWLSNQ